MLHVLMCLCVDSKDGDAVLLGMASISLDIG